jgi:hypothetical protein
MPLATVKSNGHVMPPVCTRSLVYGAYNYIDCFNLSRCDSSQRLESRHLVTHECSVPVHKSWTVVTIILTPVRSFY